MTFATDAFPKAEDAPSPIARYTLVQSIAELGLGSIIHAFHLPLGGHLLSLNQSLILTFATRKTQGRRDAVRTAAGIGSSTAVLKALSPAGKRLTPMLAIGTQGLLFSVGVGILGRSVPGVALGSALLSTWAFLQPLLLASLLFGNVFFEAVARLWTDVAGVLLIPVEWGPTILVALVISKAVIAATLSGMTWLSSGADLEGRYLRYVGRLVEKGAPLPSPQAGKPGPVVGALRDLLHPWFLASLVLSAVFFLMSGPEGAGRAAWFTLRTLAQALLLFWLIRAFPRAWIQAALGNFPRIRDAVDHAFRKLSRT